MFDILGNYRSGAAGDNTAVRDAFVGGVAGKSYWDAAYGYTISNNDFQEIVFNLKRFASFLGDKT